MDQLKEQTQSPLREMLSLAGPTLRAESSVGCVLQGAPFELTVDSQPLRIGRTFTLAAGAALDLRKRLVFRAGAPELEPMSAVGSGDVLLAAFLAARVSEKSLEESLRLAVAAGAASTLEVGAGRFEPREASRLVGSIEVSELEPVTG